MSSFASSKYSSLTQTFRISTPDGVPGVFVSKLALFFRKKSDSLGVQIYLIKQKNGLPDPEKVVPNSLVTVDAEDVNVSDDGTLATEFVFNQLLFLNAAESYAFVIKPVGNSPDYEIWVGELGKRDIADDKPIGSNPLVETAYYSGNADRWADLVNQDIKFILYRAKFTTSRGTASLRNKNTEMFKLYNISSLLGKTDVRAGDKIYNWSNNYVNTAVSATVSKLDLVNNILYVKNSTGNFTANSDIAFVRTGDENDPTSADSGLLGVARIADASNQGIYPFPIHAIAPKLGMKRIPFSTVNIDYIGATYNGTKYIQDNAIRLQNNLEVEFIDRPRYLLGETSERSTLNDFRTGTPSTNSSVILQATLTTDSNFISPVIDLNENNVVLLRNMINSNTANEHTNDGAAYAKYISKVITLEDGMEAEDLKVYINANKPANTEIHVYAKVWAPDDPDSFDSKVWSKLIEEKDPDAPALTNTNKPDEFREYSYSFANTVALAGNVYAAWQSTNADPVQYASATAVFNDKFKKFAIKIVMTADQGYEYLYPKINDLRVIALQV